VNRDTDQVAAARKLTADAVSLLAQTQAFQQLAPATQSALVRDLESIQSALHPSADPYALSLETPEDFRRRLTQGRQGAEAGQAGDGQGQSGGGNGTAAPSTPAPRSAATETLAARAGALSDEIDFPAFVASLVHGTFDAIVDASIRQMEAFADLVSAVAKDVDQFTRDNVTDNQVRDTLASQYPRDLALDVPMGPGAGQPQLRRRAPATEGAEEDSPVWLADYGLEGQPLTDDVIEEQLVPAARRRVGEKRLQMLATMVLLGMNRVNVKDGTISAKVRFRATANDKANVAYAVSQDPGSPGWGQRGSLTSPQPSTMVSTVGVNVQAETDLKVELFGEVKINFASETLPLDRFADSARVALLQRNSRGPAPPPPATPPAIAPPAPPAEAPAVTPPAAQTPAVERK
jgi:hypothetical protein